MSENAAPNRRDFLSGRAVTKSAQDAARAAADAAVERERSQAAYLMHVGRTLMACEFEIMLNAGEHHDGPESALRALDLVESLEAQLTVYRDTSEVSRLNVEADSEPVVVERGLFDLLSQAIQLSRETDGAFDITSGPLSKTWGFYRRQGRVPDDGELSETLQRVGWHHLQLDESTQSVRFLHPGLEINLGAIGKGYALDRCAALMQAAGTANFLIHGGTSSILGRGSRAGLPLDETGWTVALKHPLRPEQRLAEFRLRDRALGTSGSGSQHFFHRGKRYGHILDPRTGKPAEVVVSATVIAPTAALADALATAFYVAGPDATAAYCDRRPEISALLVLPDSKAGATRLARFGSLLDQECTLASTT
ncbi:MAG: FAD:protein FMN transferase [Pirellulales bacterium]